MSTLILPIALRCSRRIPDNSQEIQETDRGYSDLHDQRQSSLFTKVQKGPNPKLAQQESKRVQKLAQKEVQRGLSIKNVGFRVEDKEPTIKPLALSPN